MLKTIEELKREDVEFYVELDQVVKRLRQEGASEERIEQFAYFCGGPPSDCYFDRCNCPTH